MEVFRLSWKNLINRPLSLLLSVLLFSLGAGMISLLLLLNKQLQEKFEKNLAAIDLVIGAKGSPLQLILCNMYHLDAPTGNIDIASAAPFLNQNHPLIAKAFPLSLGDNYRSYRIVGTVADFVQFYNAEISEGKIWEDHFEVTIGAEVAKQLNLKIDDSFYSAHGFDHDEDLLHEDGESFSVVGILNRTGSVIDQLILTTPPTVWMVHEHAPSGPVMSDSEDSEDSEEHDHAEEENEEDHHHESTHEVENSNHGHPDYSMNILDYPEKQITSILVQFRGRNFQTLNMQRQVNQNTELQAATPAIEINRLFSLLGVGTDTLRVIALAIILVSGLSIFISLLNSLKDRKYELALMRVMGSSRNKLFLLIILEGLTIAFLGFFFGVVLAHLSIGVISGYMQESYRYTITGWMFLREELWLFIGCLSVGIISALFPAAQAFRTNISDTLTQSG